MSKPSFKSIKDTPVVSDQQLHEYSREKGVPSLQTSHATPTKTKRLNLEVPEYLMIQLKTRAVQENCTVRHLVMKALLQADYDIQEQDMTSDKRRIR